MHAAAVGQHCGQCVREGMRSIRRPTLRFGGRPTSGPPLVTYTLIAINVVAFVAQNLSPDVQRALVLWAPAIASGQGYRLLTSAFMHYGVTHLLLNMWALYIVGQPLERQLGTVRFTGLYLLSALGGSVLAYLAAPLGAATAGASGAVFGLFGATFVVAKRLNLDVRWVLGLIAANLIFTFVIPNISWQGHLGGLATGAVIAAAYVYAPAGRRDLFQAGAAAMVVVLFAVAVWWRTAQLLAMFAPG